MDVYPSLEQDLSGDFIDFCDTVTVTPLPVHMVGNTLGQTSEAAGFRNEPRFSCLSVQRERKQKKKDG